jgi:hypothetical protein
MIDPIGLLRAASHTSDTLFIWTHYYEATVIDADNEKKAPFRPKLNKTEEVAGRRISLQYRSYGGRKGDDFSGGQDEYSFWLARTISCTF